MDLASGQTVSERARAYIGHTVSQPNGLGQIQGEAKARGGGGSLAPRVEWHRPLMLHGTQPQSKHRKLKGAFI